MDHRHVLTHILCMALLTKSSRAYTCGMENRDVISRLRDIDDVAQRVHAINEAIHELANTQAALARLRAETIAAWRQQGFTLAEIGKQLGVTRARVHQMANK